MSRSLRIYGKKRRHRTTTSKAWGSAGEAFFFGTFFVLGLVALVSLLSLLVVPEWRVNQEFRHTDATLVQKRLAQSTADGNDVYRPELRMQYRIEGGKFDGDKFDEWVYDIQRSFSADRDRQQSLLNQFTIGQKYPLWYDPLDPKVAVAVRGYTWTMWVMLLVPVGFLLIGGVGLIFTAWHWGMSAERRAVAAERVASIDLLQSKTERDEFPMIPDQTNWNNSPGTHLAYRLPINVSDGWRIFTIVCTTILWNVTVAIFGVVCIRSFVQGTPDWKMATFLLPFVAIGGLLIYRLVREAHITTGVGPTHMEISDHPLVPGGKYSILITQDGRFRLISLEVSLICEEQATYRQGTDTRTERVTVYKQSLLRREQIDILPGKPFEAMGELQLPDPCMHSFKANFNEVQWKLVAAVEISGRPGFVREFSVLVYPTISARPVVSDSWRAMAIAGGEQTS